VTSSPRTKLSPTLPEVELKSPVRKDSFDEEAAIRSARGISRTGKPATLTLTKSNGSTASSVSGAATTAEVAKSAPAVLSKVLSPISQLLAETSTPPTEQGNSHPPAPSQIVSPHVASDSAIATAPQISNSAQAETDPRPVSLDNASLADDEAANSDMQRIKNLVKRKPVGATNNKENHNSHRSPTSPQTATTKVLPSLPSNPYPQSHARNYIPSNASFSPNYSTQSLEEFPRLESTTSSTTTILAPRPEIGRPSTPPLLRSPTPLSQLEESPSKYGISKKSERNMRRVDEERQSQVFGLGSNGVLRFLVSLKCFYLIALTASKVDTSSDCPNLLICSIAPALSPLLRLRLAPFTLCDKRRCVTA
jgi:hypothetical protein